jgi:hypothetical protein
MFLSAKKLVKLLYIKMIMDKRGEWSGKGFVCFENILGWHSRERSAGEGNAIFLKSHKLECYEDTSRRTRLNFSRFISIGCPCVFRQFGEKWNVFMVEVSARRILSDEEQSQTLMTN